MISSWHAIRQEWRSLHTFSSVDHLSESPKYAACRISMSDMSAFSDAAHFQNWHQQSDKSYFQWRDPILLNINFTEISFIYHSCRLFFPFDFLSLHLRFQSVILESIVGQDYFEWNLFLERKFKRYFFHFQWIEKVQKCKIIFWWASFQSPVFFESEIDWICLRDAAIKSDHYLQSALQFSTILSSDYPQSSSGWVVLFFRH